MVGTEHRTYLSPAAAEVEVEEEEPNKIAETSW